MYNNCTLEEDTQSVVSSSANIFQDVYAGKPNSINDFYFHGLIDDIRIYDRVLNTLELDSLREMFDLTCMKTIGIDEKGASAVRVYPNPTKGTLSVDFGNVQELAVGVLTNIQGQALNTWEFKGASKAVLKLEEVPGMYFLQVNLKDDRIVLPVVVD
jgi:hypothetical protein